MYSRTAKFRFYEELNDLLPREHRKVAFDYRFNGTPSVKDAVEAIGVPHTEVDLIVVNGRSVGFDYHLRDGDRVAVYPVFESLDITPLTHLRAAPLRTSRFVVDGHLGRLARMLRMLGFDTLYERDVADRDLVRISLDERRIILTRDRQVLKTKRVTHGYCVRSSDPRAQIGEVITRFDLGSRVRPFTRCMLCNGRIDEFSGDGVPPGVPAKTAAHVDRYFECAGCGKIYWKGSHYAKLADLVERIVP